MTVRKIIVTLLKATRLNRIVHHLYYRHVHGFQSATMSTVEGLEKAFARAAALGTLGQGDYYEFGMFKGYSFLQAQKFAAAQGAKSLRFFGFDSFEGLPEVAEGPDATTDDFYQGQYCCSFDDVRASLDQGGVDWSRTVLTRGFFDQSLRPALREQHGMKPVVIALIDCDLYSSTVDVLRFIEPLLMDRSILVFDDYNCFNRVDDKGQRKALAELLARRPDLRVEPLFEYGSWGAVFQISRTSST
jgi:hypothetical protein